MPKRRDCIVSENGRRVETPPPDLITLAAKAARIFSGVDPVAGTIWAPKKTTQGNFEFEFFYDFEKKYLKLSRVSASEDTAHPRVHDTQG